MAPTSEIDNWLAVDIDDIFLKAASVAPSAVGTLLDHATRRLSARTITLDATAKLLTIAQALLSRNGTVLRSESIGRYLGPVVSIASQTSDEAIRFLSINVACDICNACGSYCRTAIAAIDKHLRKVGKLDLNAVEIDLVEELRRTVARREEVRKGSSAVTDVPAGVDQVRTAISQIRSDAKKDWYNDPWGWPELNWLVSRPELIQKRLSGRDVGWSLPLDVPKPGGGVRPATVLNPLDRVAYQLLVNESSLSVAMHLPEWVHGWRLSRTNPKKAVYEENSIEWRLYHSRLEAYSKQYSYTLHIDVRGFFESVQTERLVAQLGQSVRNRSLLHRLDDYFSVWSQRRNGRGLPQRCLASSLLAHIPLRGMDGFLDQMVRHFGESRFRAVRWMDDVWLFAQSERILSTVMSELEYLLELEGLGINPEKTVLVGDPGAIVPYRVHVASNDEWDDEDEEEEDDDEEEGDEDEGDYEGGYSDSRSDAIRKILDGGEDSPPSEFSFVNTLAGNNIELLRYTVSHIIVNDFDRYSHVANFVAPWLRKTGRWSEKYDWYSLHVRQHVAGEAWTVPAWGEMLPLVPDRSARAFQLFAERFGSQIQRSLVPLAADRLVRWQPSNGCDVVMEFLSKLDAASRVFETRASLFAAKVAGISTPRLLQFARSTEDVGMVDFIRTNLAMIAISE